MQRIEDYYDINSEGCQLYDEINKCCMLNRIELIVTDPAVVSYPWKKEDKIHV